LSGNSTQHPKTASCVLDKSEENVFEKSHKNRRKKIQQWKMHYHFSNDETNRWNSIHQTGNDSFAFFGDGFGFLFLILVNALFFF
jgi:hypothetical protein